ncbi:MAG: 30S ribosomal protein S20 [Magnetococcales bacterium]|nr:30S ribosomal protein S20 [Magnetococcales bacterium]MBF0414328.1 30S ribosomal protein S20 [Magnetococcales bacterium]MBF0418579.1 30S ribosomal protein S20 [Magnetococcales bacterium]MBF0436202.1 30S ribosomal protein S20 [Magnetococcales bacterium]
MANIKSAIKRNRQTVKLTQRNREVKSRYRTYTKKVLEAVKEGNIELAKAAMKEATSVIAVTARKGVIHRNQAARRISRLNARVKAMVAVQA